MAARQSFHIGVMALALAGVLAGVLAEVQAGPAQAQQAGENAPLSAIDWLSNSVTAPPVAPPPPAEPGVTDSATVGEVSVTPLGRPLPDAVGILPASVTGLPPDLWGPGRPADIARQIRAERPDMLPAALDQLYTLLLAELNPPQGAASTGHDVFLARVDKLLQLGAVEQANALLARAGPENPEIFRRWFDTALLLGEEDQLCAIMRATPALSPTFTARVFCLARGGDWDAAVLTLGTGRALGYISPEEDALLARFLDPDLFEGEPPLPQPAQPTPLIFRLYEAIGQPIPTTGLPLAFAQADLRANIGWKARLSAGERLARTGAVAPNQLLGLYTERRPAASGGVWERAAAVQALDRALKAGNRDEVARVLPAFWNSIEQAEVEVPMARVFGKTLAGLGLTGEAGRIALKLGLLSDDYEEVAIAAGGGSDGGNGGNEVPPDLAPHLAIARGQAGAAATDPRVLAVQAGFAAQGVPARLATLVENRRLGEAILRALALFSSGTLGNLDEVSDALALFRALGLEDTARRAALQYLLLERRG